MLKWNGSILAIGNSRKAECGWRVTKVFQIIGEHFFVPLASPNRIICWECICKLFSVMDHQLSFGIERDVLVEELQYYFETSQAAELVEEDVEGKSARDKANWKIMAGLTLKQIKACAKS